MKRRHQENKMIELCKLNISLKTFVNIPPPLQLALKYAIVVCYLFQNIRYRKKKTLIYRTLGKTFLCKLLSKADYIALTKLFI